MQKQTILLQGLLSASLFTLIFSTHAQESVSSFEQSLSNKSEATKQTQPQKSLAGIPANFDMEVLTNELKTRGWNIQHKTDGSLILVPGKSSDSSSGKKTDKNKETNNQWQQLQKKLQNTGWSATIDADGAMRLTPPNTAPDTKLEGSSKAVKNIENSSFKDMQQKLKESGWNVNTNSDGSVLLYPPQLSSAKEVISKKLQPCPGFQPTVKVSLPVDSWQEAHDIAQGWLTKESIAYNTLSHSTVGKIRKIFNVYIISIVSAEAPFTLKHQIAIKNSNGAVIILN